MLALIRTMHKLFVILLCLLASAFPITGIAQEENVLDLDTCIERMSTQCPVSVGEGWAINSVQDDGEAITIELGTPASLKGFLTMLTGDSDNVKRLWIRHVLQFGGQWETLIKQLEAKGRSLKLLLKPAGTDEPAVILITPEDIGTVLAND